MNVAAGIERLAVAAGLGDAAVHLVSLDEARAVRWDDGRPRSPASMIKVPLAAAAALEIEAGRYRFSDRFTVDASQLTVNDAPSPLALGASATLEELLALMVERSDNIATNVVVDALGRERATELALRLGLRETAVRRKLSGALPLIADPGATGRNAHSAADAAALFRLIAERRFPHADRLEAMLERQYWNTKLSAGLRPPDRFAHKTGDTDEVSHDGGILTLPSGRRFVLVVYTALPTSDSADARIAAFMRALRPSLDA